MRGPRSIFFMNEGAVNEASVHDRDLAMGTVPKDPMRIISGIQNVLVRWWSPKAP